MEIPYEKIDEYKRVQKVVNEKYEEWRKVRQNQDNFYKEILKNVDDYYMLLNPIRVYQELRSKSALLKAEWEKESLILDLIVNEIYRSAQVYTQELPKTIPIERQEFLQNQLNSLYEFKGKIYSQISYHKDKIETDHISTYKDFLMIRNLSAAVDFVKKLTRELEIELHEGIGKDKAAHDPLTICEEWLVW